MEQTVTSPQDKYPVHFNHQGQRLYLGTFGTAEEARYGLRLARQLLGHTPAEDDQSPTISDLSDEEVEQVTAKVKARLEAHAKRPGRHHRSSPLLRLDSVTGLKGVHSVSRPWRVEIKKDHRSYSLGTFRCLYEEATAYNLAAEILHGPDAVLNPIPPDQTPTAERTEEIRQKVVQQLGVLVPSSQPRSNTFCTG